MVMVRMYDSNVVHAYVLLCNQRVHMEAINCTHTCLVLASGKIIFYLIDLVTSSSRWIALLDESLVEEMLYQTRQPAAVLIMR